MKKCLVLSIGLFAAFTTNSIAQDLTFQNPTSYTLGGDLTRARRVESKVSNAVVNTAAVERKAFDRLNQVRAENGLNPLAWSNELATIARNHSRNMADQKFFGHRGQDNKMVSDRADDIGLKKWLAIGENIAFTRGYHDPVERAVDLWLHSPSHRHNLMNSDWRESAVGVAIAPDGSYYLTQVFMLRK
jgi:uncharacterized protein YkwD